LRACEESDTPVSSRARRPSPTMYDGAGRWTFGGSPPIRHMAISSSANTESTYRGAQQKLPGCPTRISGRWPAGDPSNPHTQAENASPWAPWNPTSNLPGSPTRITGVPDKRYRGAQQKLPGCPTKTTGVPNKDYRGAQQKLPGCPTSTLHQNCCKTGFFASCFWAPLFLFIL
jgi:hypothetical protein